MFLEITDQKKAVIISCNDSYNYALRTKFIEKTLVGMGYKVIIISSDFDHRTKEAYQVKRKGLYLIKSIRYKKNISFRRIISLIDFSKKARRFAETWLPEFVYVSGPPNYLYKEFSAYKKAHPNTILFAEVGDMWPESMPVGDTLKRILHFPFAYWAGLRNRYLKDFDVVLTECSLFQKQIAAYVMPEKIKTIYFCKEKLAPIIKAVEIEKKDISLVYLGSINNIIDIEFIGIMVRKFIEKKRRVIFHVIGAGEQKEELLDVLSRTGAEVVDHGVLFDDLQKQAVMATCHFALNIMKDSVCVGMTMKSMDYFQCGIPIVNNIKGDIWDIIKVQQTGINIDQASLTEEVERIVCMKNEEYNMLRNHVSDFFEQELSFHSFKNTFVNIINSCERRLR